jgi:hypothetical protein
MRQYDETEPFAQRFGDWNGAQPLFHGAAAIEQEGHKRALAGVWLRHGVSPCGLQIIAQKSGNSMQPIQACDRRRRHIGYWCPCP